VASYYNVKVDNSDGRAISFVNYSCSLYVPLITFLINMIQPNLEHYEA